MEYLKNNIKGLNLTQNKAIGNIDFMKINPSVWISKDLFPFLSDEVRSKILSAVTKVFKEARKTDYYDFYEVFLKSIYDKLSAINAFVIERSNLNEDIETILTEREYLASIKDVEAFINQNDNQELVMPNAYESNSVKYLIKKASEKISKTANTCKILIAIAIAMGFIKSFERESFDAVTFIIMGLSLIFLLVITFIEAKKNSLLSENDIARESDINLDLEYAKYKYIPGTKTLSDIIEKYRDAKNSVYKDYKKKYEVFAIISIHNNVERTIETAKSNVSFEAIEVKQNSILTDDELTDLIINPVDIIDSHFDILIKLIYDALNADDKKDYEEKVVTRFYKKEVTDALNKAKSERTAIFKEFRNSQITENKTINESYIKKFRTSNTLKCISLTAISITLTLVSILF